ncbi:MAG: PAAR domain-containing protein [Polyangiaceae bacterium]
MNRTRRSGRALGLALVALLAALVADGRGPTTTTCTTTDREALWLAPLLVPEAHAEAPPPSRPGAKTTSELDGEWSGSAVMTGASSPYKPVEAAIAPYLNVTHTMDGDATATAGGMTMAFRGKDGSLWTCPFTVSGSAVSCVTTVNGYRMTMTGTLTRDARSLRISGTWTATQPMITIRGTFTQTKPLDDIEIELLHPAGKSPKVFTKGWIFGARCVRAKGTKDEKDLSAEVVWGGTASFAPPKGTPVRPTFNYAGANELTITCDGKKKTIAVETVRTTGFARLADLAQAPADAHGCPGCPHPVTGPIVMGSPTVLVDGLPAARQGDYGTHAACCGPNMYRITGGNRAGVLIDGVPAAELGAATAHCGGVGTIIRGSPGGNEPDAPPSGGGLFGAPGPTPVRRVPQASSAPPPPPPGPPGPPPPALPIADVSGGVPQTFRTSATETKVLRSTPPGKTTPASAISVLPGSVVERLADGQLRIDEGGAIVTTLPPAKQVIVTKEGSIELGSQARIVRLSDGVDVALLSGVATIRPARGEAIVLAAGTSVRFSARGALGPPTPLTPQGKAAAVRPFVDPKSATNELRAPVEAGPSRTVWALAGVAGLGVIALGVGLGVGLSRRRRAPTPAGALPQPSQPAHAQAPYPPPSPSQPAYPEAPHRPPSPSQPAYPQQAYRPSPSQPAYPEAPHRPPSPSQPAYPQQAYRPPSPSQPAYPQQAYRPPSPSQPAYPQQAPHRPPSPSQPAYPQQAYRPPSPSQPAYPHAGEGPSDGRAPNAAPSQPGPLGPRPPSRPDR